jgi:hypothetical protein
MNVAIIGTREPSPEQKRNAAAVAQLVSEAGHTVKTGGAYGIDHVAMVNTKPGHLLVCLPWATYNRAIVPVHARVIVYDRKQHTLWTQSVLDLHPAAGRLSQGAFALHARNYGIEEDCGLNVAFPSNGIKSSTGWVPGGGTAQGIRIATALQIPTICHITGQPMDLDALLTQVSGYLSGERL